MTHEKKIDYMQIAAGVCCLGFTHEQMDLLVSLYELVLKKEGKSDVDSMLDIKYEAKKRADIKSKQDLLDKVSNRRKDT